MATIPISPAGYGNHTQDSLEHWSPSQLDVSLSNSTIPVAFDDRAIDYVLQGITVVILFVVMMSLGCTLELSKIKAYCYKPKEVAIAVIAQYGIMPLTAYALGKFFRLESIQAMTILICGCCPGGNLSNILSLASKGDMNLSIVMTACSTVLALGLMPLLLFLYTESIYQGNLEHKVPYKTIVFSLFMILVPCAIGIYLNEKKPQYSRIVVKAGMIVLLLSSILTIALTVIHFGSSILLIIFSPRLLGACTLMPFVGFSMGYILSASFHFSSQCRRTICFETGCQNVQLCTTILQMAFAPEVVGALFLFPLLYLIFQLGEGLLLVLLFRICER
ncbi:hepatic sodium/bile acid cotransporter [Pogona vitticeps]